MRVRNGSEILLAAWLFSLALVAPAFAGSEKCASSQAADALVDCDHCHNLKSLIQDGAELDVVVSIYELSRGVLIDISATSDEGLEYVHRAVAQLWGMETVEEGSARVADYCSLCLTRGKKLQGLERDRAFTDDGAIIILTSDDSELVGWSRQDAKSLQRLLQRANSSH